MQKRLVFSFALAFNLACTPATITKTTTDTEQYKKLVRKYNDLLETSHTLQQASTKEVRKFTELDARIKEFNEAGQELEGRRTVETERNFASAVSSVVAAIEQMENLMLEQLDALTKNTNVYEKKHDQADLLQLDKLKLIAKANVLHGIRELVASRIRQVADTAPRAGVRPTGRAEVAPPSGSVQADPKIPITREEKSVVEIAPGQGFYRDPSGQVKSAKSAAEIRDAASRLNLSPEAAASGFVMSSRTGGIVALAPSTKELSARMLDILGHVKAAMNQNTGDLDLVLAIDYSGSMSDKIENVLVNLKGIIGSLSTVITAGRNYRIGIITFGHSGREKIDLELTGNIVSVQATLDQLLKDYPHKQHSTNPGEASFGGLNLIADRMNFTAGNRKVILITDEPSQEVELKMDDYVDEVMKKLKIRGVETTIYTIVVPSR